MSQEVKVPDIGNYANVPVIAVNFGYSDVPASELGADHVVGRLSEVPAIARSLLQRA